GSTIAKCRGISGRNGSLRLKCGFKLGNLRRIEQRKLFILLDGMFSFFTGHGYRYDFCPELSFCPRLLCTGIGRHRVSVLSLPVNMIVRSTLLAETPHGFSVIGVAQAIILQSVY